MENKQELILKIKDKIEMHEFIVSQKAALSGKAYHDGAIDALSFVLCNIQDSNEND